MATNPLRNVAEKEIYDSHLGIMRISPNPSKSVGDATMLVDEPTEYLMNVNGQIHGENGLQLSDSSGIGLPHYFVPRAFRTEVVSALSTKSVADLILQTNHIPNLYATKSFKLRSTLLLEDITDGCPMGILYRGKDGNYSYLKFPVNSPYYSGYFNDRCRLGKLDGDDKIVIDAPDYNGGRPAQMESELLKKSLEWFKDEEIIPRKEWVEINGNNIYYSNENFEAIPALHTHDFVLGSYESHTYAPQESYDGINPVELNVERETKLSWVDVDQLIWDIADECLQGNVRHTGGRYSGLFNGTLEPVFAPVEGSIGNLEGRSPRYSVAKNNGEDVGLGMTAPILGQNMQVGTIVSHAIPLRRLLFLQEKQKKHNIEHFDIADGDEWVENGYKGNFTKMDRMVPSVSNSISKNFLLCDGKEISTDNYPYMNVFNYQLFGNWKAQNDAKFPGLDSENLTGVYDAMKQSFGGKFMTPALYSKEDGRYPVYIRGCQWDLHYDDDMKVIAGGKITQSKADMDNGREILDVDSLPYGYVPPTERNYEEASNVESVNVIRPTYEANNCIVGGTALRYYQHNLVLPQRATAEYLCESVKYELTNSETIKHYISCHLFNRFIQTTQSFVTSDGEKFHFTYWGGSYDVMGNRLRHKHYIFSGKSSKKKGTAPNFCLATYSQSGSINGISPSAPIDFPATDVYPEKAQRGRTDGSFIYNTSKWWEYNRGSVPTFYEGTPIRNFYLMYSEKDGWDKVSETALIKLEESEAAMVASHEGGYEGGQDDGIGVYIRSAYQNVIRKKSYKKGHKWNFPTKSRDITANPSYRFGAANDSCNYRCLTSLPYKNFSKLGDFENRDERDSYADQVYTLNGTTNSNPYPPSVFLTPLIRI